MGKDKIIIIVLAVIVILLASYLALMMQAPDKQDVNLAIISDSNLNRGDSFNIKLTDLNGTPISGESVNISITDEAGSTDYHSVVTDENGNAWLKLDKDSGNYEVSCTYGGNDRFNGNSITQKLIIKEEVAEQTTAVSDYTYSTSSQDDYLPDVDSSGITREEAEEYGYTYTPEHDGHYIGSNDAWDEEAGVYHD